jgi:AraC-like DNA-binding protein
MYQEPSDYESGLAREVPTGFQTIRVDRIRGQNRNPVFTIVRAPEDTELLIVNGQGSILMREGNASSWRVIAPQTVVSVPGPSELPVRLARGSHDCLLIRWSRENARGLEKWSEQARSVREGQGRVAFASFGGFPDNLRDIHGHVNNLVNKPSPQSEAALWAFVHEGLGHVLTSNDEFALATVPSGLPIALQELLIEVKKNPTGSWSLRDASQLAGYSPFHLSRIFKTLIGYGFPEFVDRCRTELAVARLTGSELPIDEVASACGFGTAHGLRESVKEYLGLLPSELRALPEVFTEATSLDD